MNNSTSYTATELAKIKQDYHILKVYELLQQQQEQQQRHIATTLTPPKMTVAQFLLCHEGAPSAGVHLKLAARQGNTAVLKFLLSIATTTNDRMFTLQDHQVALVCAIQQGHAEEVQVLLEHQRKKNKNKEDPVDFLNFDVKTLQEQTTMEDDDIIVPYEMVRGTTPLHFATSLANNGGRWDAVRTILLHRDYHANVHHRNAKGETALHLVEGNVGWAQQLLVREQQQQQQQQNHNFSCGGGLVTVRDKEGRTPFYRACADGYVHVAQALLHHTHHQHNSNQTTVTDVVNATDENNITPLYMAAYNNHLDVIVWLVQDAGADPRPAVPPFVAAAIGTDGSVTPAQLLQLGLDPYKTDEEGDNVLHVAINFEEEDFMAKLLTAEPRMIETRDRQGRTALHLAMNAHHLMEPLVEHFGADLLAGDQHGRTPLMVAAWEGKFRVAKTLVRLFDKHQLTLASVDEHGWTALHWSVFAQHKKITRLLLDAGAPCHVINHLGRSPLHCVGYDFGRSCSTRCQPSFTDRDISDMLNGGAAVHEDDGFYDNNYCSGGCGWAAAEFLISRGADAMLRDHEGNLPFFLAAAASCRVTETLMLVRAAASQGLFEKSAQKPTTKTTTNPPPSKRRSSPNESLARFRQSNKKCRTQERPPRNSSPGTS